MFKKIVIISLVGFSALSYASSNASQGYVEAKQAKNIQLGDDQNTEQFAADKSANSAQVNSPTVSSFAASNQLFPDQNKITGTKGQKYNTGDISDQSEPNNPNVSSKLYSGSLFPTQNQITGTKGQKYNAGNIKPLNKPSINSRLASSSQFPSENNFNNNGKTLP